MSQPIRLTDSQLDTILRLALPLAPADHDGYLHAIAELLRHELQPAGDGAVSRAAREAQRRFYRPPAVEPGHHVSVPKYSRGGR